MHRRPAQPFLGSYTFPGGSLFFGESLDELNARQLQEKTGLTVTLTHRGITSLRLGEKGVILSHTYAHIFTANVESTPELRAKDSRFKPEWINPQAYGIALMPDVTAILEKVNFHPAFFFADITLVGISDSK
jgi:ADP-ribose pyrophosphatase YjhB (NUDIX family)